MKVALWFIVISAAIMFCDEAHSQYYYYKNDSIPLSIDSSKILIKFDNEMTQQSQQTILNSIGRIFGILPDQCVYNNFVPCSLKTSSGHSSFVDSIETIEGIYMVEPYYLGNGDHPMLTSDAIIVCFEPNITAQEIDSINQLYGTVTDYTIPGFESMYVIKNTNLTDQNTLEMANHFHEMDIVVFAHPSFAHGLKREEYKAFDYYRNYQEHSSKVVGVFNENSVWDFAGLIDTIIVAVIDDGVTSHEDMPPARILEGYDFWYDGFDDLPDNNPAPGYCCFHGMCCAGIIAASHSTDPYYEQNPMKHTGIFGINPNVAIMPIKIFSDDINIWWSTPEELVVAAFKYAFDNGADVISLSVSSSFCDPTTAIDSVINVLYNGARAGLGTPIICASGNDAFPYLATPGYPACNPQTLAAGRRN